jgi:Flp pilus assembly protein CpaB
MLAAVFGVLSAMLMFAFLSSRGGGSSNANKALTDAGGAESAVIVSQDIPQGTVITGDMLTVQSLPKSAILQGGISDAKDVVGKVATAPLYKGQQLVDRQFTTFVGQNTLAYKVPEGMRAVSLQVPHEAWIVGGLPQPGDRIDFIGITTLSRTDPLTGQDKPDVVAKVIAQNVEVLAAAQTVVKTVPKVDDPANPGATPGAATTPAASNSDAHPLDTGSTYEKAISVTLALPPDLASEVAIVDAMKDDVGQYRLLLRRTGDTANISGSTLWTLDDIFTK